MNELDKSIELLKRSSLFKKESGGDEQADMIAQYLDLLFRWNEKINLTGISDMDEAINTLVLNSMCGLEFVPINGTLLDIGSGSGIPGIVLKIFRPNLRVYLVESKMKKSMFLKEAVRTLALKRVSVLNVPFEVVYQPGNLSRDSIDIVTIRAVRLDESIVAGASMLLVKGGFFLLYSSLSDHDELLLNSAGLKLYREMREFDKKSPILYAYQLQE